jgi:hypothetical protein
MYRCEVMTTWNSSTSANIADVVLRYPGDWIDVTGQPDANLTPNPNAVVFYGVVSNATLDAIEADAAVTVIWSEEII